MKLVRLIAPDRCSTFRINDKDYEIGPDREVDVPDYMVPELLAEGFKRAAAHELVILQGPQGLEGKQGLQGLQGPPGPRGPIGPMPRHEWDGTSLRFEMAKGVWGEWRDLQGPPGKDGSAAVGGGGIFGGGPINLDGLVGGGSASSNSYFPAGW